MKSNDIKEDIMIMKNKGIMILVILCITSLSLTGCIKEETIQKETAAEVRNILNKLPIKYRDVLVLYYLEQKDYNEISDIIRKPSGTVATLLHRAKSKFKTLYNEQIK